MKIAIATTGRFHVLDLARELSLLGHDVIFYTIVHKRRALRFGLPASCHRGLFIWLAPLLLLQRFGGSWGRKLSGVWILRLTDWIISLILEPCDVFIGMSGLCINSALIAKKRYGAKVLIERGSRHVLSQKQILDDIRQLCPSAETVPSYAVNRELISYRLADIIVIPSQHAAVSFKEYSIPDERLFVNPYGVDLVLFSPTPLPRSELSVVIYVGAWTYRKGCDLLAKSISYSAGRVKLLHVGSLGDAPVPDEPWFHHQEPVAQWKLPDWYSQANCFVLASREDGFGMVLAQAIASGLPVVCTDRTGGRDLADLTGLNDVITIVPHDNIDALAHAIQNTLTWSKRSFSQGERRDLLRDDKDKLSWRSYGMRYSKFLSCLPN
jgi:starch synthase